MIRIGVKHDIVAIPKPIVAESNIGAGYAEEVAVKAEALRASSSKPIHMSGAESPGEMSVLPRMIQVVASIASAAVMANPAIGLDVHVRSVGMSRLLVVSATLAKLALRSAAAILDGRRPARRGGPAPIGVSRRSTGAAFRRTTRRSCRRTTG